VNPRFQPKPAFAGFGIPQADFYLSAPEVFGNTYPGIIVSRGAIAQSGADFVAVSLAARAFSPPVGLSVRCRSWGVAIEPVSALLPRNKTIGAHQVLAMLVVPIDSHLADPPPVAQTFAPRSRKILGGARHGLSSLIYAGGLGAAVGARLVAAEVDLLAVASGVSMLRSNEGRAGDRGCNNRHPGDGFLNSKHFRSMHQCLLIS
jgi:hypothetical protein